MTPEEFSKGITMLVANYQQPVSLETETLWFDFIGHLPFETYRKVIREIIRNEAQWNRHMALPGLVEKYLPGVNARPEAVPFHRQIEGGVCDPAIALDNIRRIKKMLEGIGKGILQ